MKEVMEKLEEIFNASKEGENKKIEKVASKYIDDIITHMKKGDCSPNVALNIGLNIGVNIVGNVIGNTQDNLDKASDLAFEIGEDFRIKLIQFTESFYSEEYKSKDSK